MLISDLGFVRLWCAQVMSVLGAMSSLVATPLLVIALFGSPSRVAAVSAVEVVGAVAAVPFAGYAIDRLGWRAALIGSDLLRGVAVGVLALAVSLGRASFILLLGVAVVVSALSVPGSAAASVAVRRTVPPARFPAAISALQLGTSTVALLGPVAAAALFGVSAAAPFAVTAATFAVSALSVCTLRPTRTDTVEPAQPVFQWLDLIAGCRFLWSAPFTRYLVIHAVVVDFAVNAVLFLVVVHLAAQGNGVGTGAVVSAAGAGNLIGAAGAVAARRFPPRALMLGTLAGTVVCVSLIALLPTLPWAVVLLGLCCVPSPAVAVLVGEVLLRVTPVHMQGRVQVVYRSMPRLLSATGPAVAAALLARTSTVQALLLFGTLLAVFTVLSAAGRALREIPVGPSRRTEVPT